MLYYARSDTHFLLYIFDKLRNELLERSDGTSHDADLENYHLERALENSRETSLQRYQRFVYDPVTGAGAGGWYSILARNPGMFDKDQFAVFRALHQWRDNVAREIDESVHRVFPKQTLIQISKIMPTDQGSMQALIKSASHGSLSQTVFERISDLVNLVRKAKEEGIKDSEVGVYLASIHPGGTVPHAFPPKTVKPANQEQSTSMEVGPTTSELSLQPRSILSQFWGSTFGSSLWSSSEKPVVDESLRLALPMPPLTAQIFESPGEQISSKLSPATIDPGARADHAYVKDRKASKDEDGDVFVIKQMGGQKRRAKYDTVEQEVTRNGNNEAPDNTEASPNTLVTDDQQLLDAKEERRASRKKRKAERKASR